jgi:hypothetical protein
LDHHGFYTVSVGWAFLSFALFLTRTNGGAIRPDAAQQAFFGSSGIGDILSGVLIGGVNAVGVFQLIRLSKRALFVFGVSLALSSAAWVVKLWTSNVAEAIDRSGLARGLLGVMITVAVLFYTRRLRQQGVIA